MNIHEYQAKKILKDYKAPVLNGEVIFSLNEIDRKIKNLSTKKIVLKAQIHAGGRGKGGGIKIVNNIDELKTEAEKMLGSILITHQTGPKGKEVKRLYIEEASEISKEFYLSCLVDRSASKIAFISSTEGGVDIEKVASENPEKIITNKVEYNKEINVDDVEKIIQPFNFKGTAKEESKNLIKSLYRLMVERDASLIEINPLIITKDNNLICLDAKMNFDANAIYRQPEILKLRDLSEEDPAEIEASKNDLAYIKLDGTIGCMVNGAGLAMATMDIIKLAGGNPANFLDVGGTADASRVEKAFRIILKDKNIKAILVNIFGGIVRCDRVAQGIVDAYENIGEIDVPIIVRLQGTNAEKAKQIIEESGLKVHSTTILKEAAQKVKELVV